MDNKAQGSFEYILLLAGVLALAAAAFVIMRQGPISGGTSMVNNSYTQYENATNTSGYI